MAHTGGLGSARTGLLVLAAAAFAALTTEVAPVGLLLEISRSFGVEEARVGVLVSAYAVMVAILAIPVTMSTRRLRRKPLLIATLAGFLLCNALTFLAPSFGVLALARILGGATHALFFSICIGYAARLAPPGATGRAMALVSVGVSAGLVLGVPGVSAIGAALGWRWSFVALTALLGVVVALAVFVLPDVPAPRAAGGGDRRRRPALLLVVLANGLTYLGHYVLYTYISSLLVRSGVGPAWVGAALFALGATSLLGIRLAAPHLDRRPRASAAAVPAGMAAGIAVIALAYPALVPVFLAAMLWSLAFGPAASVYQSAAVRTGSAEPETAGAWVVATSNAGIAGGAALGSMVFAQSGITMLAVIAAVLLGASALLTVVGRNSFRDVPAHAGS